MIDAYARASELDPSSTVITPCLLRQAQATDQTLPSDGLATSAVSGGGNEASAPSAGGLVNGEVAQWLEQPSAIREMLVRIQLSSLVGD